MENSDRRRFLRTAALAGGAAAARGGAGRARAQVKRRPAVELMNIGVVGVGEYSHIPTIWGPTINPVDPAVWPMRTSRMRISHCWDSRPEVARDFARKYQCEAVSDYDGMVGRVDGMIFGAMYEVKWWHLLTKPYLEAGIPCFINRPFALSMKHAREIVDTARRNNTPILCTDEREYIKEAHEARAKVAELLREKKTILAVNSDNDAGEYPAHGVHGLYHLLAVFGMDVDRVSFQADGWWSDDQFGCKKMTWGVLNLQYNGINIEGAGVQTRPFMASQHFLKGQQSNVGMRIYYSGGWWDISCDWEQGERLNRLYYFFRPTVYAMERMFETRKMQWSYDYILDKTRIFLAAFKSHVDHSGAMIRVADLPEDWEAPAPRPNWIDEKALRKS
jgi:predicted dehydrogenase